MIIEAWQFDFIRYAVYAALLASIACGIVGTLVVVRRVVFISGGIAHTAFGGIGLGYFMGWNPVITMLPFSVLAAIILGLIKKNSKLSEDSGIGMLWSFGMALGILFISMTPRYTPDLFSYLFGNILAVPYSDLWIMIGLDVVLIILVATLYKPLLLVSFDEEYAATRRIPVFLFYVGILIAVALTIVVLIRIVGIILVISLLTIPASIARQFTYNLGKMMVIASVVGVILTLTGLIFSYFLDLPSGAVIIMFILWNYCYC